MPPRPDRLPLRTAGSSWSLQCARSTTEATLLQGPILTITLSSPLQDIVRVRIEHFMGGLLRGPGFPLFSRPTRRPR